MVSWDLFALFKNQFKDSFVHKADPKEQIVPITILYAVTTKSLAASSKMRHAGTGNAFAGDRCTRFNAEKNDHDRHHDHDDDYRHHRRKSFLHDLFD